MEKKFEKDVEETRTFFQRRHLTADETNAIVPEIEEDDVEDDGKEREEEDAKFVPPRVVADKGFPVTKAGLEKFFEINEEVDKRDQDAHDMYIYNDFSGYSVTEVLENVVSQRTMLNPNFTSYGGTD